MKIKEDLKTLVVDDMTAIRTIIVRYLNKMGMKNNHQATDGEQAWNMICQEQEQKAPFELIICDWNMPKMTGIELLKKFREKKEFQEIPFLMVTAEAVQDNVMETIKVGISDFIVKPFTQATFQDRVERILEYS